ncbi:hypothetical protein E6W39_11200 [Kitasatospora acidiphila]|uniref:YbaK/aminoacyl-tRNA synthetase-associated domain-containing protein n=1 Tax=Kitasatospora acidiphila TaxID=2567942 RepID=A0A540W150_9ACTN|nr:hypothetical protein [Kitasatospora acidiphila]TQF02722.1 hypothetical protein E6W39_11200 [Kitasatospora acidiphila]
MDRLAGHHQVGLVAGEDIPELQLMADPALFDQEELYFNAARLDRSVVIRAADYRRLVAPQLAAISEQPR